MSDEQNPPVVLDYARRGSVGVGKFTYYILGFEAIAAILGGFFDHRSRRFPAGYLPAMTDELYAAIAYVVAFAAMAVLIVHVALRLRNRSAYVRSRQHWIAMGVSLAVATIAMIMSFGVYPTAPLR